LKPWVWSDGEPLTARDVVHTFELIRDERVASQLRGFHDVVRCVTALDSATVRYDFFHPVPDPITRSVHALLPAHLTSELDPAAIRSWSINHQPLSSGDFRLEKWDHNQSLVLVRNEEYPGPAANLERVVFRIIPEESARVLALETGEVDLVDGLPPTTAKRLENNQHARVVETGGRQFYYLLWNMENPIFRDPETRRALSLALDRERMIETLLLGYGGPATTCIPPVVWNHDPTLVPDSFDPARARSLLAGAGWTDRDGDGFLERDGHPLKFSVITKHGDPVRENGLVMIRENLLAVGAQLVPQVMELATGLERLRQGNFDVYFGRFNANLFGDPSGLVHSGPAAPYNYGHYANARVDSLVELGMSLVDRSAARPVWRQVQEELIRDPPAAYLFYPRRLVGVSNRLQDVRPHIMSPINNLSEWWIAHEDRKYRSAGEAR
jgi:peptide/nickel transport system substrate-binding protein